jgi:pyrroline-5-carboxylate reductase
MLNGLNLAIVGSGVMGEAIISGILNQSLASPEHIVAAEPRESRRQEIQNRYGIRVVAENSQAVENADIVILSVKPQSINEVMQQLRGKVPQKALVFSIVAGVPLQRLAEGFGLAAIVRVMPNTPARIGQGMSVWTSTAAVSEAQQAQARTILQALGEELFTAHEDELDMATALSGTGPAYVFLFIEALIDAGVHLGFSRHVARRLVTQTIKGSVAIFESEGAHPAELRDMVTSPGGTTAEALYQFEKGGFRTVISKAVWAAYQKSQVLGGVKSER